MSPIASDEGPAPYASFPIISQRGHEPGHSLKPRTRRSLPDSEPLVSQYTSRKGMDCGTPMSRYGGPFGSIM